MSQTKIPILDLKPQYLQLKTEIQDAINRVLESGQFILGPEVKELEQEVASYLGSKYAITVNSGTDALMIGLRGAGVQPGDEVITTPFSFIATAESISNIGAKPIFVDIDPGSFNLDPHQIASLITPRTKAIMPVHLYGYPAAMGQILDLAQAHNLKIIEDCAQSFGARYYANCCSQVCSSSTREAIAHKYTGTLGDVGAFSFFPTKNLGAYGDGGIIVTDDPAIAELCSMLRVHGSRQRYHHELLGYNSRLDSLQAAILRVKLPHVDSWNQKRRQVAQIYNQLLAGVPSVITPGWADGHVFHQYTIRITNGKRDRIHQILNEQGICTMIYYPIPQDQVPIYQGLYPPYPVSNQLAQEVLSLPIWPEMELATTETVALALKNALSTL